ncbi:MAG: hypothetical protein K0R38_4438 [Polyangiaceae bacterium]|jgi:hypothetical protein|nr:hypothetical protein [Polyangiaceae bacterium]
MELPDERTLRELVQRYASLIERFGEDLGSRPMVLPNGRFFPDVFTGDLPSVSRLLRRMQEHAGMADIPIELGVYDPEQAKAEACGTGACGSCAAPGVSPELAAARLVDLGDAWRLNIAPAEAKNPVVLTAALARALGHVFLLEERSAERPIEDPLEVSVELTAVALGFGTLLLSGAYLYQKSCGGPNVACLTALGLEELSVAFALFCQQGGHSMRKARAELEVTQREQLSEAETWALSNPEVTRLLGSDPLRLVLGDFELSAPRSWVARLLRGVGSASRVSPAS